MKVLYGIAIAFSAMGAQAQQYRAPPPVTRYQQPIQQQQFGLGPVFNAQSRYLVPQQRVWYPPQQRTPAPTFNAQPHYVVPQQQTWYPPPQVNIRQSTELIYRSGQAFIDPRVSIRHSIVCTIEGHCWSQ